MCLLKGQQAAKCGRREGQEGNSSNDNQLEMVATRSPRESRLWVQRAEASELGGSVVCCTSTKTRVWVPSTRIKIWVLQYVPVIPGLGRWRKEDSWSLLARQWSIICECQIPELDTVSKNKVESD